MTTQWQEIDRYIRAHGIRVGAPTVGQTTGGGHSPGSYHYKGLARDYGTLDGSEPHRIARLLNPLARNPEGPLYELYFALTDTWWKNGQRMSAASIGGHRDHCHVSLKIGRHLIVGQRDQPHGGVPPFPGTVRRGSRGYGVRQVQQRLADRGWRVTVDGVFGPGTERVVRAFQSEKRLQVDGVVGPATWHALWTLPRWRRGGI